MIYKYVVWYMRTKLQCDGVKILDTWKFLAITLPVHFTMNCFLAVFLRLKKRLLMTDQLVSFCTGESQENDEADCVDKSFLEL